MKSSDDMYRLMIEQIEDYAILLLDREGNIVNWNKGAQNIKGYEAAEIIGRNFSLFYTEEDNKNGVPLRLIQEASTSGKASVEGWRVRKDGTQFWGSILITALYDDTNTLTGFSKVTKDLTDRKLLADQQEQFNAALEQKVAERTEELLITKNNYQHLFANNPLPMWVMDIKTFQFLDVNQVTETVYGYSRAEFLTLTAIDIRPEEDRDIFIESQLSGGLNTDTINRGVWRHVRKNGSIIEVEVFAHNILFEGKVARLVLANDVTEKRQAERKLASRLKHFKAIIEHNNDCISLNDKNGKLLYQSPAVERVTGYGIDERRDVSSFEIFHPDDLGAAKRRIEASLASPGVPINGLCRLKHKDGYYIWVEGTTTNLLHDENINALVSNFRDVTERELASEMLKRNKRELEHVYQEQLHLSSQFSSILNALPAKIALLNNKGIIVEVNNSWREFADENGFVGNHYGVGDDYIKISERADGADAADGMQIAEGIKDVLSGYCREFSMEYRCDSPTEVRWFRVIVVKENDTADSGVVLMHLDISERKQAELLVLQQKSQLENLLRGMGDAFVTVDKDFVYTFANEQSLKIMGKSKEELIGRIKWEVYPDLVDTELYTIYNDVVKNKKDAFFEVFYTPFDMWLDIRAYSHEGGVAIFYNDITERKKAEEDLKNSEHKFRVLIENNADMLVLYDKDLRLSYCSPSVEKNAGVTLEQIRGVSIHDNVYPEDVHLAEDSIAKALANPGELIPFILRKQYDSDAYVYLEGTLTNLLDDPAVASIVCNYRDVTAKKIAEEQIAEGYKEIETLLHHTDEAFIILDADLKIVSYNKNAKNHAAGNYKKKAAIGQSILEYAVEPEMTREVYVDVLRGNKRKTEACFEQEDGSKQYFQNLIKPVYNEQNIIDGVFITVRNVTELVISQQQIEFDQNNLNALINNTDDLMWSLDLDFRLITYNKAFENMIKYMSGITVETGMVITEGFSEDQLGRWSERFNNAFAGETFTAIEYTPEPYDIWSETSFHPIYNDSEIVGVACYSRDITERQKYEETLRQSEEVRMLIMNAAMDAIMCMDPDGAITVWNPQAEKIFGWSEAEILGKRIADTIVPEPMRQLHLNGLRDYFGKGAGMKPNMLYENIGQRRNGEIFPIEITMHPVEQNGKDFYVAYVRDITERKQAEEKLRSSEIKFRALVENSVDAIAMLDERGKIFYQSASSERITGYTIDEILAIEGSIVHPDDKERMQELFKETMLNPGEPQHSRHRINHKQKGWIDVEGTLTNLLHDKNVQAIVTNFRDVTERAHAEQKIINANRFYSFISQINQTIVHSTNETAVFKEACRIAVEYGKFKIAWIGLVDKGNRKISMVAENSMFNDDVPLFTDAEYDAGGPTDIVMKTGGNYVCNDVVSDAALSSLPAWKNYAIERGLNSVIALPIRKAGEVVGTFNLYAAEYNLFDKEEITLLQEVAGDISFALDVFEKEKQRKKAEEKLRHNEFRLNEAQEIAHVGNWEIDLVTGVHSWSQEAQRIVGYVSDGSQPVFETYLSSIHPDDKVSVMKMMSEAKTTYHNAYFYHRIIRPDGEIRYVYSESKYEFNGYDEPVRLHGIIHDITNAKIAEDALAQSEENLRLIMDLIPQSIYAKNMNGKYIFVNKSFASLYGYSPNQLISKSITDPAWGIGGDDALSDDDKKVIMNGVSEVIPEMEFVDHEGVTRIFYTVKVPYTLAGTNEKAVLGIALDITERKLAETERTKMVADIVQRNKDLEQFSYIISHNLRSPVANISGITDILQYDGITENEKKELMLELGNSVKKLDAVIKDLNYILQVKQEVSENREKVVFADLLDDIKLSIKNLIKNEDVKIVSDFSMACDILTLKSYIYSIFFNLISNSIKYRQPGVMPIIEISSALNDNTLTLVFKDNGLGIDLSKRGEQVFGLYKRFHAHTEGKGIGLYMVKTQIETLGGRIKIDSEVNKGTIFTIDFEINQ